MKKIFLSLTILFLVFSLSACFKKEAEEVVSTPKVEGTVETGLVLDVTEKNDQTVETTPGDVLYLKLVGEANSNRQWTVTSPTSGDFLLLKDHQVIGLTDPEVLGGQFTDEWWLKIENKGEFDLQFSYGEPNKKAEKIFKAKVISQ